LIILKTITLLLHLLDRSIFEISKYGNSWNSKFWSGKIGLIENILPLLDIDYKEDLYILTNIIKILLE